MEYKTKSPMSANIDTQLWILAKQNSIPWSEALEFGLRFMLADKDILTDYPDNKLTENLRLMGKRIEQLSNENEELRSKLPSESAI